MARIIPAVLCLTLLQIAAASAQVPAAPRGPGAERDCAPQPSQGSSGKAGEALGDRLARSDGVLCPPAGVDPDIRAPAPDGGTAKTPVIPPPGSPGGDGSIRPK